MAQVSAELRWFIRDEGGEAIAAVDRWFRSGSLPCGGGRAPRFDVYLLDRSTDELGVKERGGKPGVEVKALVDPTRAVLTLGSRSGRVQIWSKVTSSVLTLPDDDAKRIATSKLRWLRKFDTSQLNAEEVALGGGESGEDPQQPGAAPEVGCSVEWTTVVVAQRSWRSLGLEAFAFHRADASSTLVHSLERTLVALERRLGRLPELDAQWQELSYPGWLRSSALAT